MKVFIRVDADSSIGIGHFVRSLAVAEELRKADVQVAFLTLSSLVVERAADKGFDVVLLHRVGDAIEDELSETIEILDGCESSETVLLVDTYAITEQYVKALCDYARIVYLGSKRIAAPELAAIINYSCAIDERFYEENYRETVNCLGVRYAPIRSEFWEPRRVAKDDVPTILLMSGGSDRDGALGAIAECMVGFEFSCALHFIVVVGGANIHRTELISRFEPEDRVDVLCDVKDMVSLMDRCTLAVTAGGTTTYELCARRLPFVVYSLVPEQDRDSRAIEELGIAPCAGSVETDGAQAVAERACNCIEDYFSEKGKMEHALEKMASMVPENGAALIARMLVNL